MKILITSLGVGDKDKGYLKANYQIDGVTSEPEEFVARFLSKHLKMEKLFIVGTTASIWDSVYSGFDGGDDDFKVELLEKQKNKKIGLAELEKISNQIDFHLGTKGSQCFLVNYGLNEDEIWSNFKKYLEIAEHISKDDEIYLDITHSFRSLALMSFMMVQFIEQIRDKNIIVKAIYYAILEYARENNGITPIVDISILYGFSKWVRAINSFKKYGNADLLFELLSDGDDGDIEKETKNIFMHFNNNVSIGNIGAIKDAVGIIERRLNSIKNSKNHIAKFLSPDIEGFVAFFKGKMEKDSDFQLALAKWFCDVKNYALSYLVLAEAIVTKICEKKGIETKGRKNRETAKEKIPEYSELYEVYKKIRNVRNSIAHDIGRQSSSNDIDNLPKYLSITERIIKEIS